MISNNNHIDNWLQQSATMGNPPFVDADWIAMKELLEKKRKKRLLIIWLIAGVLLMGLVIFLLWMNHKRNTNTQNMIPHSGVNTAIAKQAVPEDVGTIKQNLIPSNDGVKTTSQTLAQNNKQALTATPAANPVLHETSKKKTTIATQPAVAGNNINTEKRGKQNDIVVDNYQEIKINPQQKAKASNNVNAMLDALSANSTPAKTYTPVIKYMHNRYIDSLVNTTIASNTITAIDTTKKQLKQTASSKTNQPKTKHTSKSYFELGLGYGAMNIGNNLQTGVAKLNYSIAIAKNLYIDMGVKGFLFSNHQSQTHNSIYRIVPVLGTTSAEVYFKETTYSISNGLGIEPGIGFHYQLKKIDIGGAFNYGSIFNQPNTITAFTDSFNLYTTLPPNITLGGGDYDNNSFVGKTYATVSFNIAYAINNKWKLQASYAYLLRYHTIEGVLDDNKKRGSLYVTLGYRF